MAVKRKAPAKRKMKGGLVGPLGALLMPMVVKAVKTMAGSGRRKKK
jgi:hypothetical protein